MVKKKENTNYLFKYLLLANLLQYLEAGAVPALLVSLAQSFEMTAGEQGLLGGVVYLSLGFGSPFAGYLLRHNNHKIVIGWAVTANMILATLWALTPVGYSFSTSLFILVRFLMGLCQCIICVYLPLWANENAPKAQRTAWMSYLQASVPLGVMVGYIIAAISLSIARTSETCAGLLCWRWPILIEVFLLCPLYLGLYFVPSEHISLQLQKLSHNHRNKHRVDTENGQAASMSMKDRSESESSFASSNNPLLNGQIDVDQKTPVLGQSKKTFDFTPVKVKTPRDRDSEKKQLSDYRRHSISASIYDPLSLRDVIKRSSDNLVILDPSDDVFELLPAFHWSHKHHRHHHHPRNENSLGGDKVAVTPTSASKLEDTTSNPASKLDQRPEETMLETKKKGQRRTSNGERPQKANITQVQKHHLPNAEYESLKDVRRKSLQNEGGYFHFNLSVSPLFGGRRRSSSASVVEVYRHRPSNNFKPKEMGNQENASNDRKSLIRSNSDEYLPKHLENQFQQVAANPRSSSSSSLLNFGGWSFSFPHVEDDILERKPLLPPADPLSSPFKQPYSTFQSAVESPFDANGNDSSILQEDNLNDDEKTIIEDHLSYQTGFDPSLLDSSNDRWVTDPDDFDDDTDSDSECDSDWDNFPAITPDKNFGRNSVVRVPVEEGNTGNGWLTHVKKSKFCQRSSLWFQSIRALLKVNVYRNLLGAMTAFYFTVTGVQYWGTKYLTVSLQAPIAIVNFLFVVCAATGPTSGVLFGGWLIDTCGGYKGYKQRVIALEIVSVMAVSAFIFSLPITFLSDIYHVMICLWLLLFFGAAVLPACSGILVSIVPRVHRTTSSSLSLVIFNMFGYFLSLILSGYLMELLEYYGEYCDAVCSMTWGFRLVLFWSFFAVSFLIMALFASYKSLDEKSKKQSEELRRRQEESPLSQKRENNQRNVKDQKEKKIVTESSSKEGYQYYSETIEGIV